jgi:hypothetical protein
MPCLFINLRLSEERDVHFEDLRNEIAVRLLSSGFRSPFQSQDDEKLVTWIFAVPSSFRVKPLISGQSVAVE